MRKYAFLFVLLLFLTAGCAEDKPRFTEAELASMPFPQKTALPEPSGGFVLAVHDQTITADEITGPLVEHLRQFARTTTPQQFKARAWPEVEQFLASRVSDILLYQRAKKDLGDQADERLENIVEAEVRKFIVRFDGDYAKAEEELKQRGMDWQSFREYQKKKILSQSYLYQQLPKEQPVTYGELLARYNDMKDEFFVTPAMLKFELIDIEPAKLELSDPNQNRQEQAKELADELFRRLQAGEDFGELARQYSHGHRRMFGGLWKPVQPDSLARPYDILAAEAERIGPGRLAGPIQADGHLFIMKLIEKRAKSVEPLEKVQTQVQARVYADRQRKAQEKIIVELMQQAAIANKDEFIDFCVEQIYRISNE